MPPKTINEKIGSPFKQTYPKKKKPTKQQPSAMGKFWSDVKQNMKEPSKRTYKIANK